jgi:hypothetical protein
MYTLELASQPVMAQTGEADVVVVNVYYIGLANGHLGLTRATGTTEAAQFKNTSNAHQEGASAYQRIFAQLYQEGYSLKSTLVRAENLCTWIFVKGQ